MRKHLLLFLCSLLVAWNLQAQQSVGYLDSWPKPNGTVRAIAVSGNTVFIGGDFTSVGGQTRNRIAAIDATTGSLTSWNPTASNAVVALAVSGSTVYAGGFFGNIGGQTRNGIAAIDATTGAATSWNPNAGVGVVYALAVSGSTVYAGGQFTSIGGQSRSRIAALDATTNTNNATSWNPGANNTVYALAVSGSTVYAGGGFTSIGGQGRSNIAALDATTNTNNATSWNPGADDYVFALALSGSTVYAGGAFTTVGGQGRNYIAALDANTNNATFWNPSADDWVYALAVSGSTVYAGGFFGTIGGQTRNGIAAIDATTGSLTSWNPNASNTVVALAVSGSTVYAGGIFTAMNGNSTRQYFMPLVDSNNMPSASVSIAASANPVCAGASVTFTATPANATSPTYQWTKNGAALSGQTAATYSDSTLANSDTIRCVMNGTVTSNALVMTVNTATASITASGVTTFCADNSVTLTASAGASYQWSNNGNLLLGDAGPDDITPPPVMTQSVTVASSGNYAVTVTDSTGCVATSAATTVTVNALPSTPTILSGTTTICQGGSVTLISSAGSSYLWSNGATTQATTANTSGSYSVTVTNASGCSATSAATAVGVNAPPVAYFIAAGPTTFCSGDSVNLMSDNDPSNNYQWSNGASGFSITVTASGNYSVTVTNNNTGCSATSAATAITVNPLPVATITASGATTFCAGDSVILTASAGGSYLWSTGATTQAITANASGNYSVTLTNANGCSATSTATAVTVNALPDPSVATFGFNSFCSGGSVRLYTLHGQGLSHQWSTGATTPFITVSSSGSYSVTLTDANGCTATSAATGITVYPLPTVSISTSGPNPFCVGTTVPLTATSSNAGYSYQWKLGTTTLSTTTDQHNATAAGSYTVAVTDANGCVGTSSAFALTTKTPPAAFNLSANKATTFCAGGSVTLSPNTSASTLASFPAYQWSNNGVAIAGATALSYPATASGNYTVAISDNAGCGRTSVARAVTVNANPVPAISTPLNPFCVGGSAVLSASPSGSGNAYRWTMGTTVLSSTTAQQTTTAAGSYQVRVTDANGCVGTSAAYTLTTKALPPVFSLTANAATTFCSGGSVTLSPNTTAVYPTYQWSNNGAAISGATARAYAATASGNYTLTLADSIGCSRTSTVRPVTVNPNPVTSITASGPTTFCAGGSVVFTADSTTGQTNTWLVNGVSSGTSNTRTATASGNYQLQATLGTCTALSTVRAVTVNALPSAAITTSTPANAFCTGSGVMLNAVPAVAGNTYGWMLNGMPLTATTAQLTATNSGSYTVTITNGNGCARTSTAYALSLSATPTATITALGSTTIGAGGTVTLQAPAGTGLRYQWYRNGVILSGVTGRNIVANTAGSYTVMVTNGSCAVLSSAVVVSQTANKESLGVTSGGQDAVLEGYFSFSAFPNPADNKVTVRTNGAVSQSAMVQVMTLTGAAVKEVEMKDAQTEIELSGMASGVYLLRYKDAEGRTGVIRLVKQ